MNNAFQRHVWHPVLDLLFPKYCVACNRHILASETFLCFECKQSLPFTAFDKYAENATEIRLLTRLPLRHAYSMLYFVEQGMVREMMHHLKYRNNQELGIYIGKLLGQRMLQIDWTKDLEGIVPIPLHPKKELMRGYNQSVLLAQGLSEVLNIPVYNKQVIRNRHTPSQTEMNRAQRIQNVANAFTIKDAKVLANKHLLILDDVLTTGATMASCGQAIMDKVDCELSLATIAIAYQ